MREELLRLIENNSRMEIRDIAACLGSTEAEVANQIKDLEKENIICGYHTIINWEDTSDEKVDAIIEVNVNTQREIGFDTIAERIYNFDEVKACYLISGRYDFLIILEGKTMREVANFVSSKLSPIEYVAGTATHFIMKRYKDFGTVLTKTEVDEREKILL